MKRYSVDLYYDVFSPYSWIAFEALLRYQNEWPIEVNLKPFSLKTVMIRTGNRPPATVLQKGMYMLQDLERNNQFWGMDIQPPAKFTTWLKDKKSTTELAQKVMLVVQKYHQDYLIPVARQYWRRMWTDGEPIFSEEDSLLVLQAAKLTDSECRDVLSHAQDSDISAKLTENTETALNQGAFGAPWIVVHKDGEEHCFFGSDRFPFIAQLIGEKFTDGQLRYAAKL